MKRLIILIFIAITSLSYAQNLFISDSLKQTSDLEDIHSIGGGFRVDEWTITGIDTLVAASGTLTDSVAVYAGTIRTKSFYPFEKVDTIWSRISFKDSAGSITSIIAKPSTNVTYTPLIAAPQLIKLVLINATSVASRRWSYIIQGWGNK